MTIYEQPPQTCPLCKQKLAITPQDVTPPWASCSNPACDLFIFTAPLREWEMTPLVSMLILIIRGNAQNE